MTPGRRYFKGKDTIQKMAYRYKAFISYRHEALDIKVATEIQNCLERYHIPGSIRREKGIRSIGRIFRDKDELPSTSDLNDTIKEALVSSEFLICICSPAYTGSVWCRKELEFFLENHDKNHVLTVLADGDPLQVVPEILRMETVTFTAEDGMTVTKEMPLEPLSCDWRMDRHRARTEELPRLAASLIGCRYADLRQKMRRRQMRITAAAAGAGALLLAYFVWSYLGIQRNYKASQINQSRYLAASAQEALDGNDNLLAAQLSLAALPDEENDRPVVPEALYTLSQAVGAYQTRDLLNFRSAASYEVPGGGLYQHIISPDARHLVMMDISGKVIAIWDLEKDEMTAQISSQDVLGKDYNVSLSGHSRDHFVLWNEDGHDAALLRYDDGSVLWHQQFETEEWILNLFSAGEEDSPVILLSREDLLFIDPVSGEVFARLDAGTVSGGQASQWYSHNSGSAASWNPGAEGLFAVCPEAECVCVAAGTSYETEPSAGDKTFLTGFLTYYYRTGKSVWTPFQRSCYTVSGLSCDEAGRILLTCVDQAEDLVVNSLQKASFRSSSENLVQGRETVLLLKEGTGKVLWENELLYQGYRSRKTESRAWAGNPYVYQDLRVMPGDETHPDRELAAAATSNVIALYDPDTGETVRQFVLPEEIVSVDPQIPGDNVIRINCRNGTQYSFRYYNDYFLAMNFLPEGMDDAGYYSGSESALKENCFVIRQGETIRVFRGETGDEEWQPFDCTNPKQINDSRICGTTLAVLDNDNHLYAYDLKTGTDLWQADLSTIEIEGPYSIRGVSEKNTYLFLRGNSSPYYIRVTLADGTCEAVSILDHENLTGAGQWAFDDHYGTVSGNYIFYRASNYDRKRSFWFRYSMEDGSLTHVGMPYYTDSSKTDKSAHVFTEDGTKGMITEKGIGYLADFEKGTMTQYEDPFPDATNGAVSADGKMFAFWGNEERILRVYSSDGKKIWEVSDLTEEYIDRIWFDRGDLFAAAESKNLYRYRAQDGTPYSVLTTSFMINPAASGSRGFIDAGSGNLIIDCGSGELLMLDPDNWAVTGEAAGTLGYCEETGQIISAAAGTLEPILGACPCYSPQQLIEKGRRYAGNHSLTDEQRARYGLN